MRRARFPGSPRAGSVGTLALLVATLAGRPSAQEGVELFAGKLTLPRGAVAQALGRLAPTSTVPRPVEWPAQLWPSWNPELPEGDGWDAELPWRRWAELVRAEARDPDPVRRGRLAHLARLQGRDADAWQHLARVGDAELVQTLLPLFLPGIAPELLGSGPEQAYPAGVLLRPALPPPSDDSDGTLRSLVGRAMQVTRVRVADSLISLQVVVEADGVQVDLTHLAGPAVEVRLLPPVPPGVVLALLYADWEKVEDPQAPVTLRLEATEEKRECAVWGRFRPREGRWPRARPSSEPSVRAELQIVKSGAPVPRLERFCEALEELFRRPCTLISVPRGAHTGVSSSAAGQFFEPIRMHFGDGTDAHDFEHKFRSMISLAERWALRDTQTLAGSKKEE